MRKGLRVVVLVSVAILAVAFVVVGTSKLAGASEPRWAERFAGWGYPSFAHSLVGILQIAGGIGVLIPRSRRPAAAALLVLMIGALGTHALHNEFSRVAPPLILGGLAALVTFAAHVNRPK